MQSQILTIEKKTAIENILGKEENASNQHFLCPQCFLSFKKQALFELCLFVV